MPRLPIDWPIGRFADEQQPERQRLGERRREKRIKTGGVVARGLRVGVEHLAEFVAN